jgi:hypothetical protein
MVIAPVLAVGGNDQRGYFSCALQCCFAVVVVVVADDAADGATPGPAPAVPGMPTCVYDYNAARCTD